MPVLFKRTDGWKWIPDSDEVNASEEVLLRADNTVSDELGSRSVRLGSSTIYTGLGSAADGYDVHSIYTPTLEDVVYRMTGVGDALYVNGGGASMIPVFRGFDGAPEMESADLAFVAATQTSKAMIVTVGENFKSGFAFSKGTTIVVSGSTSNDGTYRIYSVSEKILKLSEESVLVDEAAGDTVTIVALHKGDFAFADDSYQCFVARGKTKKKWDGERLNNWGIAAPTKAPTLTAIDAIQSVVATFASGAITATLTGTIYAFVPGSTTPDTITRSSGDFTSGQVYTAGSLLLVSGSGATPTNDGQYTIESVAATTLTLTCTARLTAEGAGNSVTLKAYGGFEGHGAVDGITIANKDDVMTASSGATLAWVASWKGATAGALSLQADTLGRGSIYKRFKTSGGSYTPVNFYDFAGSTGGEADLFDMRVYFEEPKVVDKVTIMFGMTDGADPFLDDYYYFDFNIKNTGTVDIKDSASASAASYAASVKSLMSPLTPQEATRVKSPVEAAKVLRAIGRYAGSRSKERADTQAASPAWGHFAVTRGQFSRVGNTPGKDWKVITGFKVVYTVVPGSTKLAYFDDAIWTGGGSRALSGTFNVGFRFARRVLDKNGAEVYTELSPMSPISLNILLKQQTLEVTIPSTVIASADVQVDQIWVYVFGGWMDTYYRFAILPAFPLTGQTIDDISQPNNLNAPYEWARLTSHGFSETTTPASTASQDVVAKIYKSELEALTDNVVFEPGAMGPPDNIIAIAGPWNNRMFCLTEEGWLWPSTQTSPSSYSLYQCIDLRRYGTPYWVVKTIAGIFVGCSKDIVRIAGSGEQNEDNVLCDLYAQPLMISNPPVDRAVCVDKNVIGYRSADGPMMFSGSSADVIPFAGTTLLWRNVPRWGISALRITTGRFRFATDNHMIYMLAPEGDLYPTSLWRFTGDQWNRFTYPHNLRSIHREPDGSLLVGTEDGDVIEIEIGNGDDGEPIAIRVITPYTDNGAPAARKDPADMQVLCQTGGATGTINVHLDNATSVSHTVPFTTTQSGVYRSNVRAMGPFLRLQYDITGSFHDLSLHGIGMSYTQRPNMVMCAYLGAVIPENQTDLAWINQVEIECYSPNNLYLDIYKNGVLHTTETVTVTANIRDVFTVVPPRDTKGRRLMMWLRTSNADGEGHLGFELYMVRVRHAASGNVTELALTQGDQRSD